MEDEAELAHIMDLAQNRHMARTGYASHYNQDPTHPLLLEKAQEAVKRIDVLLARLSRLERRIDDLELTWGSSRQSACSPPSP